MKPTELEHIRYDIANAIVENRHDDPAAPADMLKHLVDELGIAATGGVSSVGQPGITPNGYAIDWEGTPAMEWAADLLRSVQLRAVSQIPYDALIDDEPHTLEHL